MLAQQAWSGVVDQSWRFLGFVVPGLLIIWKRKRRGNYSPAFSMVHS
jgi:hypothetical protein